MDFSIVIPCHDLHIDHLKKCLHSLSKGSGDFEVIVVLNGTRTTTPPITEDDLNLHIIYVPSQLHPSQARNRGARKAQGEWLCFLDSDCQVGTTFFSSIQTVVNQNLCVVTGRILPQTLDTCYSLYEWEIEASKKYKYKKKEKTFSKIVSGANFIIKRDLFFEIGMFRKELPSGEDRDLGARLVKKEVDIIYDEELVVYHPFSHTLKEAVQRRLWHGKGGGMIYFYHPDIFKAPFQNALQFIFQGVFAALKKERSIHYAVYTLLVGVVYYSIALFWFSFFSFKKWVCG